MPTQEFEIDPHLEGLPSRNVASSQDPYGIQGGGSITPMTGVVRPETKLIYLDPNIALERALIDMVEISRKKRADYASDADEFSNFRGTAAFAGFESPALSALFNVAQKLERIRALRANGRMDDVANEAVDDTFLDIMVYGALAYAMRLEEKAAAEG